jgi:hypothetical protein
MKHIDSKKKDLSRRDFIKTTSVGIGATVMVGLSAETAGSKDIAP